MSDETSKNEESKPENNKQGQNLHTSGYQPSKTTNTNEPENPPKNP
jgi:hypothetical protein